MLRRECKGCADEEERKALFVLERGTFRTVLSYKDMRTSEGLAL